MEELRNKLMKLINEKGLLNEKTISVSQELDKLIVYYYRANCQLISE
jgi:hypothetical protein